MMEESILAKYGTVNDKRIVATLRTFIGKIGLPIVRQLIGNLSEDDRSMHKKVDRRDSRGRDSRQKGSRRKEPQIGFVEDLKLKCKRCDFKHRIRNCSAFGKRCHRCSEKGHFKKICAKRTNQIAYEEEQEDAMEESDSEPGLFSSYQVNHLTITPNLFMSDSNINIIVKGVV